MIVEVRKAGFINKGAELMLLATIEKVRERYPEAIFTMAPTTEQGSQPFSKLVKLGFFPKAWLWRHGINFGSLANFLPRKLRSMYGLILDRDVDVVLDAAGFSYSDQWGDNSSKELADSSRRWRRRGTAVILLPQAFGPFSSTSAKKHVKEWVSNADLVFARDKVSLNYITDVVGRSEKVCLSHDFTNLISGTLPLYFDKENLKVALVPNYRMIDKTSKVSGRDYLDFMVSCACYLVDIGAKPFILVHESADDERLAEVISTKAGGLAIIKEENPLAVKAIIGQCEATIGSRFHGLVSALSQGVPSIATGWSHKYEQLFKDYEFAEGVLDVNCSDEHIKKSIDLILNCHTLREKIVERSGFWKKESLSMWLQVYSMIDEKLSK